MLSSRTPVAVAMAFAVALLITTSARAEQLLAPATGGRGAGLPGVARAGRLALDRAALAALRAKKTASVTAFPLGTDRSVDLELHRFSPFTPGARVEVWGDGGVRRLGLPDNAYFAGTVRGDASSRVVLVAGRETVQGLVVVGGETYRFGPDGAGVHRSYALRDVDPAAKAAPGGLCALDLEPRFKETPGVAARALRDAGFLPPPVGPAPMFVKQADIAIETDRELRLKFGSDQAALDYIAGPRRGRHRDLRARRGRAAERLLRPALGRGRSLDRDHHVERPRRGAALLDRAREQHGLDSGPAGPRALPLGEDGVRRRRVPERRLRPALRLRRLAGVRELQPRRPELGVGRDRLHARARTQLRLAAHALLRPAHRPVLQRRARLLRRADRRLAGHDHELLPPPRRASRTSTSSSARR